jgi:thymidylate synthase (FAD)
VTLMEVSEIKIQHDVDVRLIRAEATDSNVVDAARVSVLGDAVIDRKYDPAKDAGLIGFLMRNRHGTPFEHNSLTFFVKAPIFVFREFHRHRIGFSYNEMSGRYTELPPEFYVPAADRPLVQTGKPGAYVFEPGNEAMYAAVFNSLCHVYEMAWQAYRGMLSAGVAKEVARMVLPVGIFSQMYVTCNARSLMSFLSLRTKDENSKFPSYPQHEIELVARGMESVFADLMPITYEAFTASGRVAP